MEPARDLLEIQGAASPNNGVYNTEDVINPQVEVKNTVDTRIYRTQEQGADPGAGPEQDVPQMSKDEVFGQGYQERRENLNDMFRVDQTGENQVGGSPDGPFTNPAGYAIGPKEARIGYEDPASSPDYINKLIADAVAKALSGNVDQMVVHQASNPVQFARDTQANAPVDADNRPKYLKHYRNDVDPNKEYLELDMDTSLPQANPKRGSYIRFRRGHFFATTENQVKQLDWMMSRPSVNPETGEIVGGDSNIYEDDGNNVGRCPYGCEAYFIPGSNAHKAHMKNAHGEVI